MAKVAVNETTLSSIAEAIRDRKGVEDKFKPAEMPQAILNIEGSGGLGSLENQAKTVKGNQFSNTEVNTLLANSLGVEYESGSVCRAIGDYAFYNNDNITDLTIPAYHTIGKFAFADCDNLKTLKLNEGLYDIQTSAFEDCDSLESVVFPSTMRRVWSSAFRYCESLTNITLNEGLEDIFHSAFYNAPITELTIPNTVTSIGGSAFYGTSITSLTIPSSVKSLGAGAFGNCLELESVEFNEGLEDIGAIMFEDNSKITSLKLPSTITSIYANAFADMEALEDIYVPWYSSEIAGAPWGAYGATIHYNYTEEEA